MCPVAVDAEAVEGRQPERSCEIPVAAAAGRRRFRKLEAELPRDLLRVPKQRVARRCLSERRPVHSPRDLEADIGIR